MLSPNYSDHLLLQEVFLLESFLRLIFTLLSFLWIVLGVRGLRKLDYGSKPLGNLANHPKSYEEKFGCELKKFLFGIFSVITGWLGVVSGVEHNDFAAFVLSIFQIFFATMMISKNRSA